MGWWREQVVPRIADKALGMAEVHKLRERAFSGVAGDVLEVGFGSGLSLQHYPQVDGVWAVEPSEVAWRLAQPRIAAAGKSVHRAGLDGQSLDLPNDRFDAVVSSFSMCTIPDLDAALAEIFRVLRPAGALYFVEHGRSADTKVAKWQDRLQPINGRLAAGCHIDRAIDRHLDDSPLSVEMLDNFYSKGPKPFSYVFLGRARKSD